MQINWFILYWSLMSTDWHDAFTHVLRVKRIANRASHRAHFHQLWKWVKLVSHRMNCMVKTHCLCIGRASSLAHYLLEREIGQIDFFLVMTNRSRRWTEKRNSKTVFGEILLQWNTILLRNLILIYRKLCKFMSSVNDVPLWVIDLFVAQRTRSAKETTNFLIQMVSILFTNRI